MDQGVARGTSLYVSQTVQIAPSEIVVPMFEFPQRGVGRTSVENIADCYGQQGEFKLGRLSLPL